VNLGRAQQTALGAPDLPIAVVPHPFGTRKREELRALAEQCVADIARLACEAPSASASSAPASVPRAQLVEAPQDLEALNDFYMQRRWGDGLAIVPPTQERVERMLTHTRRARDEVVASIAPRYGAATVERIAINAVMAGSKPEYLPVLIAAAQAVGTTAFHLQGDRQHAGHHGDGGHENRPRPLAAGIHQGFAAWEAMLPVGHDGVFHQQDGVLGDDAHEHQDPDHRGHGEALPGQQQGGEGAAQR
jgi:hypothetical protein